jgi:hypothetical protein
VGERPRSMSNALRLDKMVLNKKKDKGGIAE